MKAMKGCCHLASADKRTGFVIRPLSIFLLVCCFLVIAGAAQSESGQPKGGGQGKVLVIGIIPEQNIFEQLERYTFLTEYLSKKTGLKIELKVLTHYGNIIDNFVSSGMDGAFFGSFTYVLAHMKTGVEVLVRPVALNGSSTYHGLIFVRKDSGIKGIKEMRRKRFAFVDKATTAGFLLPLMYFKEKGITNYKSYLKETYFAGTHEDAILDVLDKKADIGAAKNTVFERMAIADGRINRDLSILAKSPDVPENGLALRKDIVPSVRIFLSDALLTMHADPLGKAVLKNLGMQRFIPTTTRDYDAVFQYVRKIGLDLTRYNYEND